MLIIAHQGCYWNGSKKVFREQRNVHCLFYKSPPKFLRLILFSPRVQSLTTRQCGLKSKSRMEQFLYFEVQRKEDHFRGLKHTHQTLFLSITTASKSEVEWNFKNLRGKLSCCFHIQICFLSNYNSSLTYKAYFHCLKYI